MKQEGSYKIQGFAASPDNEVMRLKAQVELFWPKELRALCLFGLSDGMSILECGSGPGFLLEKLLQTFPTSPITGFDIDPSLVAKSREVLGPLGGGRVHLSEQSIMKMDYPDGSFDFAIARLVIEHLPDPVSAAREVRRVLKSGGKAVFIDNDFDMHLRAYPDITELDDLYKAYCKRGNTEGGNPRVGRELPYILEEAGFSNIDLDIATAHSRLIGDEAFLKSEGSGIPAQLVRDGYLPREILDKLACRWHDVLQQDGHSFYRQLFMAVGENLPGRKVAPKVAPKKLREDEASPLAADILKAGTAEEKAPLLVSYLQAKLGSLLNAGKEGLSADRPLIELGLDSIAAVETVNALAKDFGLEFSVADVLNAASIEALAAQLAGKPGAAPAAKKPGDEWEEGEI